MESGTFGHVSPAWAWLACACLIPATTSCRGLPLAVAHPKQRMSGITVEHHHELPMADPKRKCKGRAVFGGDNVRDEVGSWALFQDLGSCPATMEAARAADAYGCMPDHSAQQCDAEQAYTQAMYIGTPTWVRLPRDQWPKEWNGMTDPVCPLILALYGHPDSGEGGLVRKRFGGISAHSLMEIMFLASST